jgi:hypothetical protein
MFYIKIYVTVIVHNYKIIVYTCLLFCSHILAANKISEFVREVSVQTCHRFFLQAGQWEFWIAQRHRHVIKLISCQIYFHLIYVISLSINETRKFELALTIRLSLFQVMF